MDQTNKMIELPTSFSLLLPQFLNHDIDYFYLDESVNYARGMGGHHVHHFEHSSLTTTDSLFNEFVDCPVFDHQDKMDIVVSPFDEFSSPLDLEELELIWREELLDSYSFDHSSNDQQSLTLPTEDMEINNHLSLNHLAKAYKEAMENKEVALAKVVMGRITEKVSPFGEIEERLLYYLFQFWSDKQADYLKEESRKNFTIAFEAFYQIFPYGMIAHFTANSAILEAKPRDAEVLHVVDFDIGEGLQWSSLIMGLGHVGEQITLKLTAIKWKEEDSCEVPSWRRFQETKKRLQDCAKSVGLKLKVEEVELQDLVSQIKRMRKREGRREWLVFNCMWALPHMGRRRNRRHVLEFLAVAKVVLLADSNYSSTSGSGILIFGDGGVWEIFKSYPGFRLFFEGLMEHYQALMESIEWVFPIRVAEARLVMECLFVAPYVSSLDLMHMKNERGEIKESGDFKKGLGFKGFRMSNQSLMEAKEMVREGHTPYGVRISGENNNEMIIEWRGTPLVRVSAWRS